MACNFSANQFEREFTARRLGNWEVPKWYPDKRPVLRRPILPIANDRGHLLPGVRRGPRGPFGDYIGTWQLPKRITRKQAEELSSPRLPPPTPPPPPPPPSTWQKRSASHVPVPELTEAAKSAIEKASTAEQPVSDSLVVQHGGVIHLSDFAE